MPAYVDLLDADAIAALVAEHQPAAVVHLAAMLALASYRNPGLARKVNVEGTRNLVNAARSLPELPLFVYASSASVYGSVNPYRHPSASRADPGQPGSTSTAGQGARRGSAAGKRPARGDTSAGRRHLPGRADHRQRRSPVLMRATPGDNRMHTVDARDVALAFANAVDGGPAVAGKVLLIAGDESHVRTHRELEDAMMTAFGLGALGPGRPAWRPRRRDGWSFTGWFDTSESQALLEFQQHSWPQTVDWVADSVGPARLVLRVLGRCCGRRCGRCWRCGGAAKDAAATPIPGR